jgi:hypothetical protein
LRTEAAWSGSSITSRAAGDMAFLAGRLDVEHTKMH